MNAKQLVQNIGSLRTSMTFSADLYPDLPTYSYVFHDEYPGYIVRKSRTYPPANTGQSTFKHGVYVD